MTSQRSRRVGLPLLDREAGRIKALRAESTPSEGISCHRGCSSCCYRPVHISLLEALSLYRAIPKATLPSVLKHGQEAKNQDPLVWYLTKTPCPLLTAKQECSVYAHRPMVCRTHEVRSDPYNCDPHILGAVIVDRAQEVQSFHKAEEAAMARLGLKKLPLLPLGEAVRWAGEVLEGRSTLEELPQRVFISLAGSL